MQLLLHNSSLQHKTSHFLCDPKVLHSGLVADEHWVETAQPFW